MAQVQEFVTFAPKVGSAVQAGTPMAVNEDGSRFGSGAGVSHLCSNKYPRRRRNQATDISTAAPLISKW